MLHQRDQKVASINYQCSKQKEPRRATYVSIANKFTKVNLQTVATLLSFL